jgi:hypothetical protein
MMRATWIGALFRKDREAARAEVVRVLRRNRGEMKRAAIDLGLDRRYLFRILWRESLWHELDEIRAKVAAEDARAKADSWLGRARQALKEPKGDR